MGMDTIRVGVVGAGGNTRGRHIPNLQAIPGVEVVSVCNRSMASGKEVAREFKIPKVYSHWTQVVEDEEIDAVVIGTWPYMHAPITCTALGSGRHVMVEARMAMNAAEAREMLDTSRLYPELVAQVVPSPFTLEFDRKLQELIADGYLGELYAIEVRGLSGTFADLESPMSWRQDIDMSGLNVLSMGIYYEALARWVGHATTVMAMRKRCVRQRPAKDAKRLDTVRVPDHVVILAEMDCGAQAHFTFSAVMGAAQDKAGFWLYGKDGTLYLDIARNKLFGARRGDGELAEIQVEKKLRTGWRVEEEFIGAIRGKEQIRLTTFTEGVKYMEFTEAVALSAELGESVALPFLD